MSRRCIFFQPRDDMARRMLMVGQLVALSLSAAATALPSLPLAVPASLPLSGRGRYSSSCSLPRLREPSMASTSRKCRRSSARRGVAASLPLHWESASVSPSQVTEPLNSRASCAWGLSCTPRAEASLRGAPSSRTEPVKAGPSRPSVPVRPTRPCGTERLRRDRCSCRAAVSSEASPCNCTGPRPAGRRPRREGVMVRERFCTRGAMPKSPAWASRARVPASVRPAVSRS